MVRSHTERRLTIGLEIAQMPRRKTTSRKGENIELLTRCEAADYLGVAEQTLAIWKSTGRYSLPIVKVGRLVKYRRTDLDQFLNRRTQAGDSGAAGVSPRRKPAVTSVERIERENASSATGDFAEVRLVERQQPKIDVRSRTEPTTSLDVVLPSGVTLRLGAGCSMDLLASVVRILENQ